MNYSPKIPNILEIVDVNGKAVDWIRNKLNGASNIGKKFDEIIQSLACAKVSMPFGDIKLMTPSNMLTALQLHGVNFNLSGIGLPGINVPGINLPGINLPGIDLPGINLPGIDLPGINLPGIDLPVIDLPGINLPGIDLPGISLPNLQFGDSGRLSLKMASLPEDCKYKNDHCNNETLRSRVPLDYIIQSEITWNLDFSF